LTSFFKLVIIIATIIVTVVLMLSVRELVVKCEPVRHKLRITAINLLFGHNQCRYHLMRVLQICS